MFIEISYDNSLACLERLKILIVELCKIYNIVMMVCGLEGVTSFIT